MFKKAIALTFTFLSIATLSLSQQITVRGEFHADSIKIGVPTAYSLTARYPRDWNVLFPDSLHDFSPFEYENKYFYTTRSDSTFSYDSTVYYLSTFEIDSIQYLQIPIYQLVKEDTLIHYPKRDSLLLVELIEELPDSVQLKENTAYLDIPTQFNYPYFIIGGVILLVVLLLVFLFFGGRIRKAWMLYRLNKKHKKFVEKFDSVVAALTSDTTDASITKLLKVWKKYLEKLESRPYTKLTTKELSRVFDKNTALIEVLRSIDLWIYGGKKSTNIPIEELKNFAEERLTQKKTEVKNG